MHDPLSNVFVHSNLSASGSGNCRWNDLKSTCMDWLRQRTSIPTRLVSRADESNYIRLNTVMSCNYKTVNGTFQSIINYCQNKMRHSVLWEPVLQFCILSAIMDGNRFFREILKLWLKLWFISVGLHVCFLCCILSTTADHCVVTSSKFGCKVGKTTQQHHNNST